MSKKFQIVLVISLILILALFWTSRIVINNDDLKQDVSEKQRTQKIPQHRSPFKKRHIIIDHREERPKLSNDNNSNLEGDDKRNRSGSNNQPSRNIVYSDPINERIIGDPSWAATIGEKEKKQIEKVFQTHPVDPDIIRFSRQHSIDVVKPMVHSCYEELKSIKPKSKGWIALSWIAHTSGRIQNLKLGTNVDLRFSSFTDCILQRTTNLTFEGNAKEDIKVEYPFHLE